MNLKKSLVYVIATHNIWDACFSSLCDAVGGGRLLNDFDFYFYHLIKSNKHNLQLEMK